jgi:hypothetical protein
MVSFASALLRFNDLALLFDVDSFLREEDMVFDWYLPKPIR